MWKKWNFHILLKNSWTLRKSLANPKFTREELRVKELRTNEESPMKITSEMDSRTNNLEAWNRSRVSLEFLD